MSDKLQKPQKFNALQKYQGLQQKHNPYIGSIDAVFNDVMGYSPSNILGNTTRQSANDMISNRDFMSKPNLMNDYTNVGANRMKAQPGEYAAYNKQHGVGQAVTTPQLELELTPSEVQANQAVPTSIDRDSVSYLGGQFTGANGKMYEKEMFGPDYEVVNPMGQKEFMESYNITPESSTADIDLANKAYAKQQAAGETDWGMDGYGGVALGAGQLGLGVMSYLENQKTADKQRQVYDQQIKSNTFALDTAKAKQASMNRDLGRRPAGM